MRQIDVIDDESLREVDKSLLQLAALCEAKSLKSQFYRAGRQAVILARLHGDGEAEKRSKEHLRQAFKRAIKKASAARAVLGAQEHNWRSHTTIFEEDEEDDELLSPSARLLRELETSEYNFLTTSAEAKAVAKKELLMLEEPGLPRVDSGPTSPQKRQVTITASFTLEDDFAWPSANGSKAPKKPSLDRAALAAKKQMVRALMLEMHLRELSGQGPLPTLDSRSPGSASMPVTLWDAPVSAQKSPRVKTMPAISVGAERTADPGSWQVTTPQSLESPSSSMSPASPTISPRPSPPQASHPKGRLPDGESANSLGDNPHLNPARRPNSLEGHGTPQDIQDESPRHPQRVAVPKNSATNFADSIRSDFGLPTSAGNSTGFCVASCHLVTKIVDSDAARSKAHARKAVGRGVVGEDREWAVWEPCFSLAFHLPQKGIL